MQLRKFDESSKLESCFGYDTDPLIRVSKTSGIEFFNTNNSKLGALIERKKSDKFLIAWGGQWRTDVFELSVEDIKHILEKYGAKK